MKEKHMQVILKGRLFTGLSREDVLSMFACVRPQIQSYEKNAYITREGEGFEALGFVLEGKATVSKEKASGNRVVMTMLQPGDVFGEMAAFSALSRWPASVQALEACTILFLPKANIIGDCDRMCPWHRVFIQNFVRMISDRALMLSKKVEYLSMKGMREKLANYLLEEQQKNGGADRFTIPMNRNELADFLNVSRPTMSRELALMKEEGLIDYHLSNFRILDIPGLRKYS